MGRNMSEAGAAGEAGAEEYDDDVFVPHYGNYVHAATPTRNGHQPQQGSCLANKYGIRADLLQVASAARRNSAAEEVSITQGLFSTRTFSPPPSVLRQIGTQQQPWKSGACGDSSSLSSIDNVSKVLHHNCYHFLRIWCQESQSGGLVFPLFLMHRHDAPGFAFDPRTTKEFFV